MIAVYFESKSCAELVALFVDEEAYEAAYKGLEKLAKDSRMIVTDSEDYDIADLPRDMHLN